MNDTAMKRKMRALLAGALIDNAAIAVRGGRIVSIGPAASAATPRGAETIDLTGEFVTSGFVRGTGAAASASPPPNESGGIFAAGASVSVH